MNGILRITDPILSDNSIDKYEDVEYEPVVGTNLNSSGQDIRTPSRTGGRIRRLPSCRVVKPHQWTRLFAVGGDS